MLIAGELPYILGEPEHGNRSAVPRIWQWFPPEERIITAILQL